MVSWLHGQVTSVVNHSRVSRNAIDRSGGSSGVALGGGIFDLAGDLVLDHTKVDRNLASGDPSDVQRGF